MHLIHVDIRLSVSFEQFVHQRLIYDVIQLVVKLAGFFRPLIRRPLN